MATVASLGITFNTTAGNKTVTATPTASDLIVVVAAASGTSGTNAATTAVSDNNTDGLGTYTSIADSGSGGSPRTTIWIRNNLVGSATSTVFTATQASSNGGGLEVFRVTSMTRTGSGAARGFGTGSGASSTTPAVTLQQAALTGNPLISNVTNGTSPGGVTAPASWTRTNDTGYSTPATGLDDADIASGFTGSTITWGSTSASAWVSAGVELDTSAPPSTFSMFCGEELA